MRALDIDFVRRRAGGGLGVALLVAGLAGAGWTAWRYAQTDDALAEAASQRERLARRQSAKPVAAVESPEQRQAAERLAKGATRVAQDLTRPWGKLLGDIEQALDDNVALLSLDPDASRRQVRLTAEARSLADALAFVSRLEGSGSLHRPRLANQESKTVGAARIVAFTVVAEWDETR